jgi:hypothetical protein
VWWHHGEKTVFLGYLNHVSHDRINDALVNAFLQSRTISLFVKRKVLCWLVYSRENYYWLVADKPNEQGAYYIFFHTK